MNRAGLVTASLTLLLAAVTVYSQQQSQPSYDPNNPDGAVMFPNKMGRTLWKRKGVWKTGPIGSPGGNGSRAPIATAAELQSMRATLDVISKALQATPRGSDLIGYWMNEPRNLVYPNRYDLPPEVALPTAPLEFESGFYPFYLEEVLVNGAFKPQWGGETEGIYFVFNRLPGHYNRPVIGEESVGPNSESRRFYLAPQITGTYQGFPVYEAQDLVIARANRSPWSPAPYGRVLRAALPRYEKDRATAESRLAGLRKSNEETQAPAYEQKMRDHLEKYSGQFRTSDPKKWEVRLAGMERELRYNRELAAKKANPQRGDKDGAWYWNPIDAHAAITQAIATLSPADAAKPACWLQTPDTDGRYTAQGRILPAGAGADPVCQPVVTDNHASYFDPRLPRSAPQILMVRSFGRCGKVVDGRIQRAPFRSDGLHPPQGCNVHVPIWDAADWNTIASTVIR